MHLAKTFKYHQKAYLHWYSVRTFRRNELEVIFLVKPETPMKDIKTRNVATVAEASFGKNIQTYILIVLSKKTTKNDKTFRKQPQKTPRMNTIQQY